MTYKTIVVHLDCGKRRGERLDVAVRLAEEFDAHLIGLFALDLYAGRPPAAHPGSILVESELQRREDCLAEALDEFTCKTARRADKTLPGAFSLRRTLQRDLSMPRARVQTMRAEGLT